MDLYTDDMSLLRNELRHEVDALWRDHGANLRRLLRKAQASVSGAGMGDHAHADTHLAVLDAGGVRQLAAHLIAEARACGGENRPERERRRQNCRQGRLGSIPDEEDKKDLAQCTPVSITALRRRYNERKENFSCLATRSDRLANGLCTTCGIRLYRILTQPKDHTLGKVLHRACRSRCIPINDPGRVQWGICLSCEANLAEQNISSGPVTARSTEAINLMEL